MIELRTASLLPRLLGTALCALPLGSTAAAEPDAAAEPRACLPRANIKKTEIIDGRNIAFIARDGTHYLNELARECPSMQRSSLLNYSIANGQICAGNTFTVLWQVGLNRIPAFTCQLGLFLPRTEDEIEDLKAVTSESRSSRRRTGRDMIETAPVETPTRKEPESQPR